MNIIVLDLEWNSAYCHKTGRFLNEILEFGAVMLDGDLREADRFQCIVKSSLTKKLRGSVKELTHISNDDMRAGVPFKEAVKRFTEWAGENLMLTWSDTDIHVIIENCKVLLDLDRVPFLYKYADIQKYIMAKMGVTGNQISLTAAAEQMGVDFGEFKAHRALGDSLCCTELLRRVGFNEDIKKYIVDATRADYYNRFLFKSYPINDLNSEHVDKKELYGKCPKCEKQGKQLSKWKYKNRNFGANFFCNDCNEKFTAKVRFKKTYDGVEVYHFSMPYKAKIKEKENKNES